VKAVVQDRYGPPHELLELREVDEPVVRTDEVLVRVHATSVNPADWHLLRGEPRIARLQMGFRNPKETILGCDVAGKVEEVGRNVTTFRPGDEAFGSPFMRGFGGFAQRASIPEDVLAGKPANLSFAEAAAVPLAALTALQGLRDHGRIGRGQKVMIIGASGGVGIFAVQIAKFLGAEVTAVCSSGKVDLVRSIGADHVVDYTCEDFADGRERYDLVFQLAGTRSPSDCRNALTPKGTLVLISGDSSGRWVGPVRRVVKALVLSPFVSQTMVSFTLKPNRQDLQFLRELIEAGHLSPVIDRTYSLAELPEAIRYLEEGHARGKVVVAVE
jgi:NADPH:quinone reductase-like Zn-dependent oxidoreductase